MKDLHLVNLEDFRYGGTNITAFRLVDPNNPLVQEVVRYDSITFTTL
jgi:ionotropic glutamate receptor